MTEEKKKRYVGLSGNIKMKSGMAAGLPRVAEQQVLDDFSFRLFGMTLTEARKKGICVNCKSPHIWGEGELTGLCKECQHDKKD